MPHLRYAWPKTHTITHRMSPGQNLYQTGRWRNDRLDYEVRVFGKMRELEDIEHLFGLANNVGKNGTVGVISLCNYSVICKLFELLYSKG